MSRKRTAAVEVWRELALNYADEALMWKARALDRSPLDVETLLLDCELATDDYIHDQALVRAHIQISREIAKPIVIQR